jgi:hypothetical protein
MLQLELDKTRFLVVTAESDQVACALQDRSAIDTEKTLQDDVLIDWGNGPTEWLRNSIAGRYMGKTIYQLWFGRTELYVYTREMPLLIRCSLDRNVSDNAPILFWGESQ